MGTAWRIVTVNMTDQDDARLVRLADLWGLSKAAAVRRLIADATPAFLDEDVPHTCREGQRAKWGISTPNLPGGPCPACWPEGSLPTRLEREDAMRAAAFQLQWSDDRTPWFVHVVERRRLHQEEE
tara:strand:- start:166 stop:543 length:378 start_codon:yes stop_codon:yes gene_type:complete